MLSQRLIESEDFSLDSQIMHAASSQPEPLGWPGSGFSRQPGTIAAARSGRAAELNLAIAFPYCTPPILRSGMRFSDLAGRSIA